jgi:hypothetical protein
MCAYCGAVFVLGPDGAPRRPTAEELAAIRETEGYAAATRLRADFERFRSSKLN